MDCAKGHDTGSRRAFCGLGQGPAALRRSEMVAAVRGQPAQSYSLYNAVFLDCLGQSSRKRVERHANAERLVLTPPQHARFPVALLLHPLQDALDNIGSLLVQEQDPQQNRACVLWRHGSRERDTATAKVRHVEPLSSACPSELAQKPTDRCPARARDGSTFDFIALVFATLSHGSPRSPLVLGGDILARSGDVPLVQQLYCRTNHVCSSTAPNLGISLNSHEDSMRLRGTERRFLAKRKTALAHRSTDSDLRVCGVGHRAAPNLSLELPVNFLVDQHGIAVPSSAKHSHALLRQMRLVSVISRIALRQEGR